MKIQAIPFKQPPSVAAEAAPSHEPATSALSLDPAKQALQQQQQSPELHRAEIDKAVEKLNQTARILNHNTLQFEVNDSTNRIVIKVIDSESKEVIREIPPEGVLEALKRIDEYLGLLLDKRV